MITNNLKYIIIHNCTVFFTLDSGVPIFPALNTPDSAAQLINTVPE